jgi:hypothetical protein
MYRWGSRNGRGKGSVKGEEWTEVLRGPKDEGGK